MATNDTISVGAYARGYLWGAPTGLPSIVVLDSTSAITTTVTSEASIAVRRLVVVMAHQVENWQRIEHETSKKI